MQPSTADLKIILLGDSAVGKSKLMERFLLDDFIPHQLSTYALTLYRHKATILDSNNNPQTLSIDFWDTAGQERFQSVHPSYYVGAHCCIMVFDVTRKITYKNLDTWYAELVSQRGIQMPIIVAANKVDMDPSTGRKSFGFVDRKSKERNHQVPLYYVSASSGDNVVALFQDAITKGLEYKEKLLKGGDASSVDEILQFIEEEGKRENTLFSHSIPENKAQVATNLDLY